MNICAGMVLCPTLSHTEILHRTVGLMLVGRPGTKKRKKEIQTEKKQKQKTTRLKLKAF